MKPGLPLGLGLLLLLLAGCRSERAAFRTPAAPPVVTAPAQPVARPAAGAGAASEAQPALPRPAPAPTAPEPASVSRPLPDKPAPLPAPVRSPVAQPTVQPATQPPAPKRTGWDWGSILRVIGTGLFLGGLVLGLAVGGWAGFGIFLLGLLMSGLAAFCGSFLIDGQLT